MDDYDVDRAVRLKAGLVEVLNLGPRIGNKVVATRTEVAGALADLCRIRRPSSSAGIEMLCEIVVRIQAHSMSRPESIAPGPVVGGTYEIGWPIDPAWRLNDCVIAALDLGLFDPVGPMTPRQERTAPEERSPHGWINPPGDRREELRWPVIEPLPDGTDSEFSPDGGQWIATRRAALCRYRDRDPEKRLSVHAQFLWDLEGLLSAVIDTLTETMADFGHLNEGHGQA